jgi:hypothetical protein
MSEIDINGHDTNDKNLKFETWKKLKRGNKQGCQMVSFQTENPNWANYGGP